MLFPFSLFPLLLLTVRKQVDVRGQYFFCRFISFPCRKQIRHNPLATIWWHLKLYRVVYHLLFSFFSYETPLCESDARSKSTEIDDPFKDRELPGQRGTRSCLCLLPFSHVGTLKKPRILLRMSGISLTMHVLSLILFCVILGHLQFHQWTGKGWECFGGPFIVCALWKHVWDQNFQERNLDE